MTYSSAQLLVSDIVLHLPDVLGKEQKDVLAASIGSLARGDNIDYSNYFETNNSLPPDELSQGDAYEELPYLRLPINTLPLNEVPLRPSMVLSNSCATSPDRNATLPARVIYAPIIKLDKLKELIERESPESIQLIEDIRRQLPMNYFYLPATSNYSESVVLFDNILSVNNSVFESENLTEKLRYRLSLESWYHLLIKLSAYFTRVTNPLVTERE